MKKLNLPSDEFALVPPAADAPPELELPPLEDAPPEAETPPDAPPLELLTVAVPPRLVLPVVPPDFEELLSASEPPDDAVAPPLRPVARELEDPPALEVPPELDAPAESLPAAELALLLVEPPEDDLPPEDDDISLAPPCPPPEVLSPLEPPELSSGLRADPAVSSAPHPPRTGKRISEKAERNDQAIVRLYFAERIYVSSYCTAQGEACLVIRQVCARPPR